MLKRLYIHNYALIRDLDIGFENGLSALTGETGAGKSIILGALSLVMGARAETKTITDGEEKCVIEAMFAGNGSGQDNSSEEIIIRRELNINGRSRSFVNDEVITQSELKTLAARLIDIHSQHENLLLADDSFQLNIVDTIADNAKQRDAYYDCYKDYTKAITDLETMRANAASARKDRDYMAFQYEQLEAAHLSEDDDISRLEKDIYYLSHIQEFKARLSEASQYLDNDEYGVVSLLQKTSTSLGEMDDLRQRVESASIEIKDILGEINRLYEDTEVEPERLQVLEDRLSLLNSLLKKHDKHEVNELIELRDNLAQQLKYIDNFDEETERLQSIVDTKRVALADAGRLLTDSRLRVKKQICDRLQDDLQNLGIRHAKVDIDISPATDFTEKGMDIVHFLFAANLNQSLRPVADVASGGEMSRLMLCLKAIVADNNGLPTIIFDEIDTGVSGAIATRMGHILHDMATKRQIIVITHLPQIASQADIQYRVYKHDEAEYTETHIKRLEHEERINDIALMLSGNTITASAIETARQLLED